MEAQKNFLQSETLHRSNELILQMYENFLPRQYPLHQRCRLGIDRTIPILCACLRCHDLSTGSSQTNAAKTFRASTRPAQFFVATFFLTDNSLTVLLQLQITDNLSKTKFIDFLLKNGITRERNYIEIWWTQKYVVFFCKTVIF